jgi:hypothetical protein
MLCVNGPGITIVIWSKAKLYSFGEIQSRIFLSSAAIPILPRLPMYREEQYTRTYKFSESLRFGSSETLDDKLIAISETTKSSLLLTRPQRVGSRRQGNGRIRITFQEA